MSNDIKIHHTSDDKTDGRFRFRKYNINTFYIERERGLRCLHLPRRQLSSCSPWYETPPD